MVRTSKVLEPRLLDYHFIINPADGENLNLSDGSQAELSIGKETYPGQIRLETGVPKGVILIPRKMGIPLTGSVNAEIKGLD